jgi:tRNA A37 methylthiotransferase MiaB
VGRKKIFLEGHGCSRRYAEVTKFRDYFKLNAYEIINNPEKADYILITTCAFKKYEEELSITRIKSLRQHKAKLLVYGCLPDIAPTRFKEEFDGIDFLAPKNIDEIDKHFKNIKYKFSDIKDTNLIPGLIKLTPLSNAVSKFAHDFQFSHRFFMRTIEYAKNRIKNTMKTDNNNFYLFISRGCLGKCSYCAIRHAVGSIKSKRIETIIEEFENGIKSGHKDFVLLGDDVGAYGIDIQYNFPELLSCLFEKSSNGTSFHIEEIHPIWMILYKDELLKLISSKNIKSIICPIQSGNNRVLDLMGRDHDIESILDICSSTRNSNPEIKLLTQIIIGFPTETEEDFNASLQAVKQGSFDAVTIFPYDEKENTRSAAMTPKVPADVVQQRVDKALKYFRVQHIKAFLSCPK